MNLEQHFEQLLSNLGKNNITPSPYDTAWIGRLTEMEPTMSQQAIEWLRENQLPDGSWGTPELEYYHERLICTLSAIVTLARYGNKSDTPRLEHAQESVARTEKLLKYDLAGATIGFELIVPTLMDEARALNLLGSNGTLEIMSEMAARRAIKFSKLPKGLVNRNVTIAHSCEMIGIDGLSLLDASNLQEANGSVGYSPAATVFFALNIKPADPLSLSYLHTVVKDGTAPYTAPIDVFEIGWGLWNLSLTEPNKAEMQAKCQSHLDFLYSHWRSQEGIAACSGLSLTDGDTSVMIYEALKYYGREVDLEQVLKYYEASDHFLCFPLESDPSVSTNVHFLSALHTAGYDIEHPFTQRVLRFLQRARIKDSYWFDKWHSSPYYPTAHAIINCLPYDQLMIESSVQWILATQRHDGSWGHFLPTAEETAYCLQALILWRRHGGGYIPPDVIRRGATWLAENMDQPYTPLWIGKSLYTPVEVVRSAVLSALKLAEQG